MRKVFLISFVLILFACNKIDDLNNKPTAYALTLPVIDNDALGVTLRAKIINPNHDMLAGYGFIISFSDYKSLGQLQDLDLPVDSIHGDLITLRLTSGLFPLKVYVHAYIIIAEKKIIFNSVPFTPVNTSGFNILNTWPEIIEGDTVYLETDFPLSANAILKVDYETLSATRQTLFPIVSINDKILSAWVPYLEDLISPFVIPTIVDQNRNYLSSPDTRIRYKSPQIILPAEIPVNKTVGYPIVNIPNINKSFRIGFLDGFTDQFLLQNDSIFFRTPKLFRSPTSFIYIDLPGRVTTYNHPAILPIITRLLHDTVRAGDTMHIITNVRIDSVFTSADATSVTYANASHELIYAGSRDSTISFIIPTQINPRGEKEIIQSDLLNNIHNISVLILKK